MAKVKERNEVEYYKGIIRSLQSENRKLHKRIRELQKMEHHYGEIIEDVVEDIEVSEVCEVCGKGLISTLDLGRIVLKKCQLCGDSRRIKPNGQKKTES